MEDADESVGELTQGGVMTGAAGTVAVVVGAGAGRGLQCGEGLQAERVDEPVVVDVAGGDDLLLAGLAGDGAGAGVVAAGLPAVGAACNW